MTQGSESLHCVLVAPSAQARRRLTPQRGQPAFEVSEQQQVTRLHERGRKDPLFSPVAASLRTRLRVDASLRGD